MSPLNVTVGQLIDQIEQDLPDADPVTLVGEARNRARTLGELGDKLIDHFIQAARHAGASWSQIGDAMGVSKQAAQQRAGNAGGRFARFTDRARKVVTAAQSAARDLGHPVVDPEHVLAAVLAETDGLAAKIVEANGSSPVALAERVRATLPPPGDHPAGEHVPFSPASKKLLEKTAEAAFDLLNNYVGTEHILIGALNQPERAGAKVLIEAGIDGRKARDMVAAALMGWQESKKSASGG
jgi:hypothetical protein